MENYDKLMKKWQLQNNLELERMVVWLRRAQKLPRNLMNIQRKCLKFKFYYEIVHQTYQNFEEQREQTHIWLTHTLMSHKWVMPFQNMTEFPLILPKVPLSVIYLLKRFHPQRAPLRRVPPYGELLPVKLLPQRLKLSDSLIYNVTDFSSWFVQ